VKGACENCGATTHIKQFCVEKPRARPAKYTHKNIAADDVVQPDLVLDFDGKRDRWNGYNPAEYQKVIERM